jgi:5-hydroxyisourate hydrolase
MTDQIRASLSTHVLDATTGQPARNLSLRLDRQAGDAWEPVGDGTTDDDGRCRDMAPDGVGRGVYRLVFDTGAYFSAAGTAGFYPEVPIVFAVTELERHHHVPLLLSPFAYSTYRGS